MDLRLKEPKQPLLALVGPTAVGKTAVAMQLAPLLQTEIICADSAQVYRYLDIGTAKPTAAEQALVKHHLLDLADPDREFSVADYQACAYRQIEAMGGQGRLPFLVGGTGLYIKAVVDRYAFGARGKSTQLREELTRQAEAGGSEALHERLSRLDPRAAAKIHTRDRRRIIRALEVYQLEGRPISEQVDQTRLQEAAYHLLIFGLEMPRSRLYQRIEERVEGMLEQGFLEEVRNLLEQGYPPQCPGLQILGYRQLVSYLLGQANWDERVAEIKMQTRRLAKRQLTWFRRDKRICWMMIEGEFNPELLAEIIYKKVKEILPLQTNSIV